MAEADELSGMMTYPIAGLAAGIVPEQVAAMRHPDVVYVKLSDHPPGLVSRIVAVHRPRTGFAVIRLLELVTSSAVQG
jgi:hypothetical protein